MMGGLFHYYTEVGIVYSFIRFDVYGVYGKYYFNTYFKRYDVSGFNNGYILEAKAEGWMKVSIPFSTE